MELIRKNVFYLLALGLLALTMQAAKAADFSVTDINGKTHKLSQYKGKWVLVNFWASWCPPCLMEIPDLIDLHNDKKNNVAVIGIAIESISTKQLAEFANVMSISYPIVLGNQKMAAQIGPVDGLPTTYLYNPQGKLVAHQTGPITSEAVLDFIKSSGK